MKTSTLLLLAALPWAVNADELAEILKPRAFLQEITCGTKDEQTLCRVYSDTENSVILVAYVPGVGPYENCPKDYQPVVAKRVSAGNPVQEIVWMHPVYSKDIQ